MSTPKLITIVHPDSKIRASLRKILEAHGCTVATDHSCSDLLSDESGMIPTLILVDRSLVRDEGADVVSRLSHKWAEAEVVVLPEGVTAASTLLPIVDRLLRMRSSRELLEMP